LDVFQRGKMERFWPSMHKRQADGGVDTMGKKTATGQGKLTQKKSRWVIQRTKTHQQRLWGGV